MNISATGVQYAFGEKEPILKRGLWALLLFGGFAFLCYHMHDRIATYTRMATVTSVQYENWKDLPFPQVTFCPNQYYIDRLFSTSRSDNEEKLFKNASTNWTQVIIDWAPKREELFEKIKFQRNLFLDTNRVNLLLLEERACWALNANGSFRSHSGFVSGLEVTLNITEGSVQHGDINGYNVLISNPNQLPSIFNEAESFPLHQQVDIHLTYEVFKQLQVYGPNGPNCVDESYPMELFPIYTEHHCALEKMAELILSDCNCSYFVGFESNYDKWYWNYFLKVPRLCNRKDTRNCITPKWQNRSSEFQRKCPPTCTTFSYNTKLYHAPSRDGKLKVRVFFKTNKVKTTTESLAYHWLTLMADLGGAAGLFLGASLFTLVEIAQWLIEWCISRHSPTGVGSSVKSSLSPIQVQPTQA